MNELTKPSQFNQIEKNLYKKLKLFYTKSKLKRIVPYILCKSSISLRVIDYFINKFRDRLILWDKTSVNIKEMTMDNQHAYGRAKWVLKKPKDAKRYLDVKVAYHSMVKCHSKVYFDSCKRVSKNKKHAGKFKFSVDDITLITTLSQLNFFRWLLETRILHFLEENEKMILDHYNTYYKNIKKERGRKTSTK